jgi:hypothetical protein
MMKKGMRIYVIVFALAILSPSVVAAEEGEKAKPWERFSLNVGGFVANLNSDFRIGSQSLGVGLDVNPEDALGLDSSLFVFRADALWRFTSNRRHRFELSYYDLRRASTKTLEADIQINDKIFSTGTTVDTLFDLQVIRAGYSYSLIQDDRIDLGISAGLYVMPIRIKISSTTSGEIGDEGITAPLPVAGLHFDFAITPKFFLKQSIDVFYFQYQNFQGGLLDTRVGVEYNIWKHFGVGVAYEYFRLQVKAEGQDYPNIDLVGKIQFNYGGIMLYGKLFF